MRYKIVIEVETESGCSREFVNRLAEKAMAETVTRHTNPVFLSTEIIANELGLNVLRGV